MASMPTIKIEAGILVPHLDQYFGPWAVLEKPFLAMVDHVQRLDIAAHIRAYEPSSAALAEHVGVERTGGSGEIAVVRLEGTLMKHESSVGGGTSMILAQRQVRAAIRDPDIVGLLLSIDSPGGTVAGTEALGGAIAEAAKDMPVFANIQDLGASGAYWLASQATQVFATPTAIVGSIGTFTVIVDSSEAADAAGVKVHVIRAGEFKGKGAPGTAVSDDVLAEIQRNIDALNEFFIAAVARGRGMAMTTVRELADGRVHIAHEAAALGLIDGVQTFEETLSGLIAATSPKRPASNGGSAMSKTADSAVEPDKTTEPQAATFAEIKAACPEATSDFICEQLESSATVDQARAAWGKAQSARIAELEKTAEENKKTAKSSHGVRAVGGGSSAAKDRDTDDIDDFESAFQRRVDGGMSRARAMTKTVGEDPERHQRYLEEYNATHKVSA